MSKFIKLTNADKQFADMKILLNTDHITTVFQSDAGGSIRTTVYTIIGNTNFWTVEESLEQIHKMIKEID
jgi:hypothetical protein